MNYSKLYNKIIKKRIKTPPNEQYVEKHHILPRCLGGNNTKHNIVILTLREHFICHYLLTKIYKPKTREWYKMINAFIIMIASSDNNRYINSRLYESKRKYFIDVMRKNQKGNLNSSYGTMWIYNLMLEQNKKIPKSNIIPEGWKKGRVMDFSLKKKKAKDIEEKRLKKEQKRKEQYNKEKVYYVALFENFKNGNYVSINDFIEKINYEYSSQTLTKKWRMYDIVPILSWGKKFSSKYALENMVGEEGHDPSTSGLSVQCSSN